MLDAQLSAVLASRQHRSMYRRLVTNPSTSIDFSSNDFLGLSRSAVFKQLFLSELAKFSHPPLGSTGSRLLDGNSSYAEDLESFIARFHNAETALLFNSGFDANSGFFGCVPRPGDVVLYDEYIHASVHEGMRVSRAGVRRAFKHNDVRELEAIVREIVEEDRGNEAERRNVFVAVETVYSMDGDVAPLGEIVEIVKRWWPNRENGYIVVDEAHATGVYGYRGRGVVCELSLEPFIFARLHTFGKALASSGAVMLCSQTTKNFLVNYARPLIYSTFLSYSSLASIKCAYKMLSEGMTEELQHHVHALTRQFRESVNSKLPKKVLLASTSPIQGIVLQGNPSVRALATHLNGLGFIVKPIASPTVPVGHERVRICLHGHNTFEEVDGLVDAMHRYFRGLEGRRILEVVEGEEHVAARL